MSVITSIQNDNKVGNGREILLIEDSVAISILVRDFLNRIGYENVHTCDTGNAGIQTFNDLLKNGKDPIVFLDYSLPDMNASEVMQQLFQLRPDVKIILETAEDRNAQTVKDALRHGAYLYLEKPIRFENLKHTMAIIKEEDQVLENGATVETIKIESILKSSSRVSLVRLSEYSGLTQEEILVLLKQFESQKKIMQIDDIKEIVCNCCGSVRINEDFACPSCNDSNFQQAKLIEHFKCGNVETEDAYENHMCPKCGKEIKIIGVDHRIIYNFYICQNCKNKFPEPSVKYICSRCNNKFGIEQAKWITSQAFKVIN